MSLVATKVQTFADFNTEATRFASSLEPSQQGATFVTLSGELGAGKTAFTKGVAKALGVTETVNSPTFVLEKIYALPQFDGHSVSFKSFKRLIHIDAYRLESGSELKPLGFDEIMQDSSNLVLLEWPEKVADVIAKYPHIAITIDILPDNARKIISTRHD